MAQTRIVKHRDTIDSGQFNQYVQIQDRTAVSMGGGGRKPVWCDLFPTWALKEDRPGNFLEMLAGGGKSNDRVEFTIRYDARVDDDPEKETTKKSIVHNGRRYHIKGVNRVGNQKYYLKLKCDANSWEPVE